MIRLTREPIDYHALTESVRRPHCGAVVTFLGTVRDLTGDQVTVALDYDAYPAMAEKKMEEIEADTRARWPVGEVALVHRLGHLEVGAVSDAFGDSKAQCTSGTGLFWGMLLLPVALALSAAFWFVGARRTNPASSSS